MGSEPMRPEPAVGQRWRLRKATEGHRAGEVVTVRKAPPRGSFEECAAAHPDRTGLTHGLSIFLGSDFSDAAYLGMSDTPPAPVGEKPLLSKTQIQCALASGPLCERVATSGYDLDGYMFCDVHRAHGRWAPAPVGAGWAVRQRRRGRIGSFGRDPGEADHEFDFTVVHRGHRVGYDWTIALGDGAECGFKESWPSVLIAPAPATPESVTPGTPPAPLPVETAARDTEWCPTDACREALTGPGLPPAYGRVGNATALEAIRAKREPEPWKPSIDEFDLLPDAPGVTR